jgi:hypothetical protein
MIASSIVSDTVTGFHLERAPFLWRDAAGRLVILEQHDWPMCSARLWEAMQRCSVLRPTGFCACGPSTGERLAEEQRAGFAGQLSQTALLVEGWCPTPAGSFARNGDMPAAVPDHMGPVSWNPERHVQDGRGLGDDSAL